jgi:prepilin-type N-terminal cleavage/methylation domain-containing protein
MKNLTTKKGFTLIELLVVVAIIGLITSIVLVSLEDARAKSRDSKRLQTVKQYTNALELYAGDNGGLYPEALSACLGAGYPSGECLGGTYSEDDNINNIMDLLYIEGPPASLEQIKFGNTDVSGIGYTSDGNIYTLHWFMSHTNASCAGELPKYVDGIIIRCEYTLN